MKFSSLDNVAVAEKQNEEYKDGVDVEAIFNNWLGD